jgi:CBS domain-containing protein
MDCRELLSADTFSIHKSDTVRRASEIMQEADIGFLPVCDGEREVVGVITDRDIVTRVVAAGLSIESVVEDVMTKALTTVSTREKVHNAVDKMRSDKVRRLVCVDDNGSLAGVISLDDIAALGDNRLTGVTFAEQTR